MQLLLSMHQPYVLTELEDGTVLLSLFHTLDQLLSIFHTLDHRTILLMLSIISILIFLPTILLNLLVSLRQALDLLSSITEEMDILNQVLSLDMNLPTSIIRLHTLTTSINSTLQVQEESTLDFHAIRLHLAILRSQ